MKLKLISAVVATTAAVLISGCADAEQAAKMNTALADHPGEDVYMEYCSACHDQGGEPGGPPAKSHLQSLSEAYIRTTLTEGKMVAMAESIAKPQLDQLIAYLRGEPAV